MEGQIKNKFDLTTIRKIGLEGLKYGAIIGAIFILQNILELDLGQYAVVVAPIIRWLIGNLEQFKKGE